MRKRTWTKQQLLEACTLSTSVRQVLGHLGLKQAGGNYAQIKKYIKEHNVKTDHFKGHGWSKGLIGIGKPRLPLQKILVKGSLYQSFKLKKRLFKDGIKTPSCELCGWCQKAPDGRIPLEIDHINGDSTDNRLINLRILCPNCHSLQPTHRGLNRKRKG